MEREFLLSTINWVNLADYTNGKALFRLAQAASETIDGGVAYSLDKSALVLERVLSQVELFADRFGASVGQEHGQPQEGQLNGLKLAVFTRNKDVIHAIKNASIFAKITEVLNNSKIDWSINGNDEINVNRLHAGIIEKHPGITWRDVFYALKEQGLTETGKTMKDLQPLVELCEKHLPRSTALAA